MTRTLFLTEEDVFEGFKNADPAEVTKFWETVARYGTPLQHLDGVRTTFLWRDTGGNAPMHLHINGVTDKQNHELGLMRQVPGTDLHVRTLELSPTHRASYGFQKVADIPDGPPDPPSHDSYPLFRDPLNRTPLVVDGDHGLSVVAGPFTPRQREWEDAAADVKGTVLHEDVHLGGVVRRLWLHLPAGAGPEPLPLLTLFDAEAWFGRLPLPQALEYMQAQGALPPLAVLGVSNVDYADRCASLGASEGFLAEVAGSATGWATDQADAHGLRFAGPEGRIIAGKSLGGLSALYAVLTQPGRYSHAIAASPSLWWEPDRRVSPDDLGSRNVDWITEQFAKAGRDDTRLLLSVGIREGLRLPRLHQLEQTMRSRGRRAEVNVYDGGHDLAWWRGALVDDLVRIFGR